MDEDLQQKKHRSIKLWRDMVLNGILALAALLLLVTAFQWAQEVRTERAYALLSDDRSALPSGDRMEENLQSGPKRADPLHEEASPVRPDITLKEREADPEPAYPYQTNPNARWLALNPDYSGWIRLPGTSIDYPFVRGSDNEEYLKKDFYGKPARAGTIFLDYRNVGGAGEAHTLLYGHNMKNGTMFHDLVKYHAEGFLEENPLITLSDLYGTRTYRIFSVYEVSAEDYTLPLNFDTPADYRRFLDDLARRSLHEVEPFPMEGQLLSLITCSYGVENGRTIVHALAVDP